MPQPNFDPSLYLVADSDSCKLHSIEAVVWQAIQGGITMVQIRSKNSSTDEFIILADKIRRITEAYQIPLIINDRVDVALVAKASGVHLGQSDMDVRHARSILGNQALIGFSVSSYEQAKRAVGLPIDYLGAGPVFETQTKKDVVMYVSLWDLKRICELTRCPVVGIGGIQPMSVPSLMKTGIGGIAVASAICGHQCPLSAARDLKRIIQENL